MIRYVIAVLLTSAIFAIAFVAVEHGSTVRAETQLDGELTKLESAAVSLVENDDPVPGEQEPPRRTVDVQLPTEEFASKSVDTLVLEPMNDTNYTQVRYSFDGQHERASTIHAPLVNAASEHQHIDLSRATGVHTLRLELVHDRDHSLVVAVTVG